MSIEFIGFISNNNSSETVVREGPVLNPTHIETVAKAHENAGFDRALLAFHSTTPDALQVAQHVLNTTSRLNVLIAQRPGFTESWPRLFGQRPAGFKWIPAGLC
ncbi:alkanesulfonate monooxygenase SsuD/methylene tetrahydromethanopterin reductase-like flavin-dependent oxidoreductase (luciferase family) [Bradyrhizobium diazoefficiens]